MLLMAHPGDAVKSFISANMKPDFHVTKSAFLTNTFIIDDLIMWPHNLLKICSNKVSKRTKNIQQFMRAKGIAFILRLTTFL